MSKHVCTPDCTYGDHFDDNGNCLDCGYDTCCCLCGEGE